VWQFANYDAHTCALKRNIGPRQYTIDLVDGRWIVTLDSASNQNGQPI
jgi:hypothetical protein